jgi:uncharacterized protein (DUF2141 family)
LPRTTPLILLVTLIFTAQRPAFAAAAGSDVGKAEARCRVNEPGPAILVDVGGLKDRKGLIKVEIYPSNDADFLSDDSALLRAGKVFRRAEQSVGGDGPVTLCLRIPAPGNYSIVVLHDRDANHKYNWFGDGVGFAGNPKLGWHKPLAAATRIFAGTGLTRTAIVMNYRHGLGVAPERHHGLFQD